MLGYSPNRVLKLGKLFFAALATVVVLPVASSFFLSHAINFETLDVKSPNYPVSVRDRYPVTQVHLTFSELVNMPRRTVFAELYCEGVFIESGNWTGVRLKSVIERVGISSQNGTVEFYANDGYLTRLNLSTAMREDIIIAHEKDGRSLSEITRLVVPNANGAEWISMINQLNIVIPSDNKEISIIIN